MNKSVQSLPPSYPTLSSRTQQKPPLSRESLLNKMKGKVKSKKNLRALLKKASILKRIKIKSQKKPISIRKATNLSKQCKELGETQTCQLTLKPLNRLLKSQLIDLLET